MQVTGRFGVRLGWGTLFAVTAFVGCGGSSQTRGESEGDGERGGTSGANSGGGSGGGVGAAPGSGGVGRGGSSRGGSGAATADPPPGPQYCAGVPCDAPLACCMTTGECFDPRTDAEACATPEPDPSGVPTCASNAHCAAGEYCSLGSRSCMDVGRCEPLTNCPTCDPKTLPDGSPNPACRVCGCDGNTYPYPEAACHAGVNAVHTMVGCGEPAMEGGAGSSSIPQRTYVPCGHDGQCQAGSFCCPIDSRCHVEEDREICVPPPPGARLTCRTTADCGDREYCSGEGCDALGGCVHVSSGGDCGVVIEPVCGCDGTSYTSADCAASRGVRVAHEGECTADGAGNK